MRAGLLRRVLDRPGIDGEERRRRQFHLLTSAVAMPLLAVVLTIAVINVALVADGVEALEALAREPFDIVLLDCQMPRLDGYETATRIKADQRTRHLPVVALTAHAMKGDRDRCLAAGMDDYVAKPFGTKDLRGLLDKWCSGRGAQ